VATGDARGEIRPEAVLLEGKLIKEFRPRYNISFRDDKKFLMVKVNLNDPFPRFAMTRVQKEDGARYFGPFAHSTSLRKTIHLINKRFHLRSCHRRSGRERLQALPGSHHQELLGAVREQDSREQYLLKVKEACDFLEGISADGHRAGNGDARSGDKMDFEKAARLRNLIDDLKLTTKPMKRFKKNLREYNPRTT